MSRMSRVIAPLALAMFALGLDAFVVAGLLPAIATQFGVDTAQAGQAVSAFTLCYALSAPIFATLLAGRSVRRVLLAALGLFTLANASSALAPDFGILLLTRALAGIGAGVFAPLALAGAAALVPPARRGRALGLTMGGMSCGTVLGVPLGLWLAHRAGWQSTLWLVAACGAIGFAGIALRLPDVPAAPPPSLRQRLAMLLDRRVAVTVAVTFLIGVGSLGLYTYVAPILATGGGVTDPTPYFWAWGVGGVAASVSIGTLIDRTGRPRALMAVVLATMSVALALLPSTAGISIASIAVFAVWGAMGWSTAAPQQHILLGLQPRHGGAAVALNSSCSYLGSAAGAVAGGALLAGGMPATRLPFVGAAVIALALLLQWRSLRAGA